MAKIINMFAKGDEDKRVVANKNSNWREVLTGKEFDELSYVLVNGISQCVTIRAV